MGTRDHALHLLRSPSRLSRVLVGRAALGDQAIDLLRKRAHGGRDPLRGRACLLRESLDLGGHDRESAPRLAGARGLDAGVEREEPCLLGDALDGGGHGGDLRQHGGEGAQPLLDTPDGGRQPSDMIDRAADESTRLGDLAAGIGSGALSLARGAVDLAVARDHGLGRLMQLLELRSLPRDTRGEVLEMAGDVGDLDTQRAEATRQLLDQAITVGPRCDVGGGRHAYKTSRGSPPGPPGT